MFKVATLPVPHPKATVAEEKQMDRRHREVKVNQAVRLIVDPTALVLKAVRGKSEMRAQRQVPDHLAMTELARLGMAHILKLALLELLDPTVAMEISAQEVDRRKRSVVLGQGAVIALLVALELMVLENPRG